MTDYNRLAQSIQRHDYRVDARNAQAVARELRQRGLKIRVRKTENPAQRILQAT